MAVTAIKLKKNEEDVLDRIVKTGLFTNKEEAARAAIVKYASDLGVITPDILWGKISKHKKRKVTPEQLKKDIETLEDEA